MFLSSDLPPPQLYIILGVIATACAIISNGGGKDTDSKTPRIVTSIVLICATIVAAVPVAWPVAKAAYSKINIRELTNLEIYRLHLIALVILCMMAIGTFIAQGFRGLRGKLSQPFYFLRRRRLIRQYKKRLKKFDRE